MHLYSKTNHWKNRMRQVKKFLDGVPYGLEVVNLGTTHAKYAFDYSDTGLLGFNFALQSQTLSYDLAILETYLDHLSPCCKVIIPICPLVFAPEFFSGQNNRMYYHFLPKERIQEYSPFIAFQERHCPVFSSKRAFISSFYDVASNKAQEEGIGSLTDGEMEAEAALMERCWCESFSLSNLQSVGSTQHLHSSFELNQNKLAAIVSICEKEGFPYSVVVLPFTDIMAGRFSLGFLNEFVHENVKSIVYEDRIFDYFSDVRFASRHELFYNSEFLNERGRSTFTRLVLAEAFGMHSN